MKKIIQLLVVISILTTFSYAEFIDIDNTHWGYEAVCNMADNGILSGYPDGSFKPSKNITLDEYASIFANFFAIAGNDKDNYFVNIEDSHWAKSKIEAIREYIQPNYDNISESLGEDKNAYEDGIVTNMPITREVVIYSLNSILALDNSNYTKGEEVLFADYEKILYPEAAVLLYKNGIISGENKDGKVYMAPDRYISRAEIASMFNKLFIDGKKIQNTETIEEFENVINTVVDLTKSYKLNEVKKYIYDSGNILDKVDFDTLTNKNIKNIIRQYFKNLEYDVVEYGFYGYNKAYIKLTKTAYDYKEILKPLKSIGTKDLNDIVNEINNIYSKQTLTVNETTEVINFIKNDNEWKIEL